MELRLLTQCQQTPLEASAACIIQWSCPYVPSHAGQIQEQPPASHRLSAYPSPAQVMPAAKSPSDAPQNSPADDLHPASITTWDRPHGQQPESNTWFFHKLIVPCQRNLIKGMFHLVRKCCFFACKRHKAWASRSQTQLQHGACYCRRDTRMLLTVVPLHCSARGRTVTASRGLHRCLGLNITKKQTNKQLFPHMK